MNVTRDQFKLSFIKTVFHVSKSSKTGKTVVTCTLAGFIRQPEIMNGDVFNVLPWWDDEVFTATGKAVCSANDTDNIEIGKAVAQAKAESKCYATASKILHNRVDQGLAIITAAMDNFEDKANGVIAHNEEYINKVTDPTSELYKRKVSK